MGYKKGQQIRMTERLVGLDLGEVFTLTEDGERAVFFDSEGDRRSRTTGFELVTPKWEPKVGDRVRITKHCNYKGDKIDMEAPIGSIQVIEKLSDQLYDYGLQAFSLRGYKRHIYSMLNVETLAAPTTLTIQAGRYYKTRDGRKVGPIKRNNNSGDRYWVSGDLGLPGYGSYWCKSGAFYADREYKHDLIAEWVDDLAAPTKPKFKVGDVVVDNEAFDGEKAIVRDVKGSRIDIEWLTNGKPGGLLGNWPMDGFILATTYASTPAIVALIENGTPKPATRPVIHASQADATKEAERLALLHAGQEFGVFVLADSKIADVVEETVKRTVLRAA